MTAPEQPRVPVRRDRWEIPTENGARFRTMFSRAMHRVCPYCGQTHLFKSWFNMNETCSNCGVRYEREDGYFLGGYAINLVTAEFIGIGIVVYLLIASSLSVIPLEIIAVALAGGLPLLFFPFSRALWMALDLYIDKELDREVVTGQTRWSTTPGE